MSIQQSERAAPQEAEKIKQEMAARGLEQSGKDAPYSMAPIFEAARTGRGKKPVSVEVGRLGGDVLGKLPEGFKQVAGMPIRVDEDLIRKNDKLQRNPKAQRDLGIRPPSDSDYARIFDVINSADSVGVGLPRRDGTKTLEFRKKEGDNFVVATAIRNRAGHLAVVRFVKEGLALPLTEPSKGRLELTSVTASRLDDSAARKEDQGFSLAPNNLDSTFSGIYDAFKRSPDLRRGIGLAFARILPKWLKRTGENARRDSIHRR